MARAASALKQTDAAKAIAPKSPPPALDNVNGPRAHPDDVFIVMFSEITISPHNPRIDEPVGDTAALEANIKRYGQIEPLICHTIDDRVAAFNGRRRLKAVQNLFERNEHDGRVKITLREDFEDAAGVVLSEELMREAFHPADEARLYAKMFDCERTPDTSEAETIEQIAKVFGRTVRHVEQRMRLARLFAPILDALHKNQITLDQAQAWTRAPDSQAEEAAWKAIGAKASVATIQKHFEKGALRAGDRLCKLVGEAAYIAAGGRITRDLFGADEDTLWLDARIVRRLADEKLAAAKKELEAEGWAEVRSGKPGWNDRTDSSLGTKRKPTVEEKALLKGLHDEQRKLADRIEALEDRRNELSDDERKELYAANDRSYDLEQQIDSFDDRLIEYGPKDRAKAHAFVRIDDDGKIEAIRGIAPPKKGDTATSRRGGQANYEQQQIARQEKAGISDEQVARLTDAASGILARAVAATPKLALVVYCAGAAASMWARGAQRGQLVSVEVGGGRRDDVKLASETIAQAEARSWKDKLSPFWKKPGAIEAELLTWSEENLLSLFAFLIAQQVDREESRYDLPADRQAGRARCAVIARAAGVDASTFALDEAVFVGMTDRSRAEAAAEIGVDLLAKGTPKQHAAQLADAAGEKGWVHPIMREMLGLDAAAPKAKPAPKKAVAKKAPPAKTPAAKKPAPKKAVRK